MLSAEANYIFLAFAYSGHHKNLIQSLFIILCERPIHYMYSIHVSICYFGFDFNMT